MIETILAALLALNPATLASDPDRARTLARAIDSASLEAVCGGPWRGADPELCKVVWPDERIELVAALIVQGTLESGFAENVHSGRCRSYQCDAIRVRGEVRFLAVSSWQLHASPLVPLAEWRRLAGTEFHPTADAALAAARVLGRGRSACGGLEGAIAMYATGNRCRWSGAAARARRVALLEARLRAAVIL